MQGAWRAEETLQLELRVRGGGLVASCCASCCGAARDEEARSGEGDAWTEEEARAVLGLVDQTPEEAAPAATE